MALKAVLSVKDMKRILSRASDALEISSRRKIYITNNIVQTSHDNVKISYLTTNKTKSRNQ